MEKLFNGLDRISLFAQELVSLVSIGKHESTKTLLDEMEKQTVVHYIYNKYKDHFTMPLDDDSPYNVEDWEAIYHKFSDITPEEAKNRLGIYNEDDGLLLLVTITLEAMRDMTFLND